MGTSGAMWAFVAVLLGGCVVAAESDGGGGADAPEPAACETAADCEASQDAAFDYPCKHYRCDHGACHDVDEPEGQLCGGDSADPVHGQCDDCLLYTSDAAD